MHWWPAGAAFAAERHATAEELRAAARETLRQFGCLLP